MREFVSRNAEKRATGAGPANDEGGQRARPDVGQNLVLAHAQLESDIRDPKKCLQRERRIQARLPFAAFRFPAMIRHVLPPVKAYPDCHLLG